MASNDEQIDLLMRRFATRSVVANGGGNHLDADEMSAFAEGALPAAARARYVSHLAECDQCRRQVADLSIASGAVARVEQAVVDKPERVGLLASLTGLFALPVLRYAAIAAALVVVAGVAFVALRDRPQRNTALVAKNEGGESPTYAVKPPVDANSSFAQPSVSRAEAPASLPAPSATQPPESKPLAGLLDRQEEARANDVTVAVPVEPMKEAAKPPEVVAKKADGAGAPSGFGYSPAPPQEKQGLGQVQTQSGGFSNSPGGPRQQQSQNQNVLQPAAKAAQSERERDAAKDARYDESNRKSDSALAANRANDEKLKGGPSRNMDNLANNRASNETRRGEAPKTEGTDSEDKTQTRSAGGHKFQRQGSAWVDQKFKTSMSLKNVARGSEEFSSLDSGLRSIAQQISGEIIVVWKGKAYLIK